MTPAEYLDAAMEKLSLHSDIELAAALGDSKQVISGVRNNKRAMPEHVAARIATTLGKEFQEIWLDLKIQREKRADRIEAYRPFVIGQKAAAIVLTALISLAVTSNDSYANDTLNMSSPALKAAPSLKQRAMQLVLCKLIRNALNQIAGLVRSTFATGVPHFGFADL